MNHFKKMIIDKKINYLVVANLVGVSELTIYRYANGKRFPPWDIAKRIAEVFGLSDRELLTLFDNVI